MRITRTLVLVLAAAAAARADCSFTWKTNMGADSPEIRKTYIKGHRMMTESAATITIWDLDARTITHIDKSNRTYRVSPLNNAPRSSNSSAQMDSKETGQHKTIGGFDAHQIVMTLTASLPGGMRSQVEGEMWYAHDVPGTDDFSAFYKRMGELGLAEGRRTGLSGLMSEMETSMANLHAMPLMMIMHTKVTGGDAKLAEQLNSSIGDVITETNGFSTSPVAESVFTVPAGFRQTE